MSKDLDIKSYLSFEEDNFKRERNINKKPIKNRQFKHAFHINSGEANKDAVAIKELIQYEDGTAIDNLRILIEPKRKYYVTKTAYAINKQKKEHELLSKLDVFECTQSNLYADAIRRTKGSKFSSSTPLNKRTLNSSPHIYGSDIHITELIKYKYDEEFSKGEKEKFTTSFYDIEKNMEIMEASLITHIKTENNPKHVLIDVFVNKNAIGLMDNDSETVKEKTLSKVKEHLPKSFKDKFKLVFNFHYFKDVVSMTDSFIKHCHSNPSDFLTAWNVSFDILELKREIVTHYDSKKYVEENLIKYGHHNKWSYGEWMWARLLTDPNLPDSMVRYEEHIDPDNVTTAGGVNKRISNDRRWHRFRFPASFHVIDQMATHSYLRITDRKILGGYSLDNILRRSIGLFKLTFEELSELDGLLKLEWHKACSSLHPIEYTVYNIWDVILCLMLELDTKDLSTTLPIFINRSSFDDFSSSSKYVTNDFHFYALNNDRVLGTSVVNEQFGQGLGRRGFTITLPPWPKYSARDSVMGSRVAYLSDSTSLMDGDGDVVAAYPSATSFAGISKDTTRCEILNIHNVDNHTKWKNHPKNRIQKLKELNVSLFSGESSHEEYSVWMYDMPDTEEFSKLAEEHFGIKQTTQDYKLSKDVVYDLKSKLDNKTYEGENSELYNLLIEDNGEELAAYYQRESKLNKRFFTEEDVYDTEQSNNNHNEETLFTEAIDKEVNNYQSLSRGKSGVILSSIISPKVDLTNKKGLSVVTKHSNNPRYTTTSKMGMDSSNKVGFNTVTVTNGKPRMFRKANKPNLDTLKTINADTMHYGGVTRTIGNGRPDSLKSKCRDVVKKGYISLAMEI